MSILRHGANVDVRAVGAVGALAARPGGDERWAGPRQSAVCGGRAVAGAQWSALAGLARRARQLAHHVHALPALGGLGRVAARLRSGAGRGGLAHAAGRFDYRAGAPACGRGSRRAAPHQPHEAAPAHRDALRDTRGALRGQADHRGTRDMTRPGTRWLPAARRRVASSREQITPARSDPSASGLHQPEHAS